MCASLHGAMPCFVSISSVWEFTPHAPLFVQVIRIPLPNRKGREDIMKVHAAKYFVSDKVDWTEVT